MIKEYPIVRVMDDEGQLLESPYREQITEELALALYTHMLRIRTFDRKAISLQRQGRLGTYPPFEGQEAAQVGSALALEEQDWLFPTYRDHGATLTFGQDMVNLFLYWQGRLEGLTPPHGKRIFPPAVPIATQIPHAVGAAWAEKRKGTSSISIVYFGDGATSAGDFHEGLNFASVYQVPVVLFNQNNGIAISLPVEKQMNSKTIAQKGMAYDIPSIRIDGNDAFIVYFETKKAAEAARKGMGPTLIEAVTWRYGAHTTADDPTRYRDQGKSREIPDPLQRLIAAMKQLGYWDESSMKSLAKEIEHEIEEAVRIMEKADKPLVEDLFDYTYETLPPYLNEQKENYLKLIRGDFNERG
ncbi:pyruvate dehydrogenase (acetyl-transferring) E1 component subunit alpha [Bacillus sp. 1P06AnD]|uniref:pyruvate dehydrogenase (acetyl-transferring) E1 component subunit alpha n=1 Tax=Bacillus sp. 1P06AnD TaxID=3132208 RepID=UPI0039A005D9